MAMGFGVHARTLLEAMASDEVARLPDVVTSTLFRILVETYIDVRWLARDPVARFAWFHANDLHSRLTMAQEMADALGAPNGLSKRNLREWPREVDRIKAMHGLSSAKLPTLEARAKETGDEIACDSAFRFESSRAVHVTPLALDAYAAHSADGRVVVFPAQVRRLEPPRLYVAAHLAARTIDELGMIFPTLRCRGLRAAMAEIDPRLAARDAPCA